MTTTEDTTLRQKLDALIEECRLANQRANTGTGPTPTQLIPVMLRLEELQSLAEMLREDEPPDTTGTMAGLYTITRVACDTHYSVTGEGIHNRHDVPVFVREVDAESMCRCLSLAYRAGQRRRSRDLMRLLDED